MKRMILNLFIFFAAFCAADLFQTADTLHEIEQSVIRLHIPADSDTTQAQTAKLLVRDALLEHTSEWIPEDADFAQSCAAIRENLPKIRAVAAKALQAAGYDMPVQASFGEMRFPERSYGDFTLPAGEYTALQITLGSGKGQNWWCVMYPALCLPAASDCTPADVFSAAACDLTAHPEQYEVRLKCVDLFRSVQQMIAKRAAPQ